MLIRKPDDIIPSDITSEAVWRSRRDLILRAGVAAAGLGLPGWAARGAFAQGGRCRHPGGPAQCGLQRHGQADFLR